MNPVEIEDISQFHSFLQKNETLTQISVVIYKKSSGKQKISFDALLEEAICFGFIDTKTRSVDDKRYEIVFNKRQKRSHWSESNLELARKLMAEGRMRESGLKSMP